MSGREVWAFTGHRPGKLGGYEPAARERLDSFARQVVLELPIKRGIVGMALGFDQAIARACERWGVPFIAAVPFYGQEARWSHADQREYHRLLTVAQSVEYVTGGCFSARAMQQRNEWMVKHGERVCALWDGSAGGTGNAVRYAARQGKPLVNCWSGWQGFTASTP
jgi:uncharacterized phage-like protein YoqJ